MIGFFFGKDFTWFLTKKKFIFEKKETIFFFRKYNLFSQKPRKILTKKTLSYNKQTYHTTGPYGQLFELPIMGKEE